MADGKVVLRRTWPQRIMMLLSLGVIGSALAAAWFVQNLYVAVADLPRIQFAGDLLDTETPPGEPVNFLIIGLDSAAGIDPDDPIHLQRKYDPRGTFNADGISLVRVDPVAGQVWMVSIPRDLVADIPRSGEWKINAASLIGGPPLLVETINEMFGIQLNHYVQLDFLAFRDVVDQINGVPVWFDNPARDLGSHLDVPVGGCNVLDGGSSLAYVRARRYEEFVDGEWVSVGSAQPDLDRIERQQDFLVLALQRAISRGARNLTTMSSLIAAGAQSVVLDDKLTPAELVDLAQAFADFDPELLQRFTLEVIADNNYRGPNFSGQVVQFVDGPLNEQILETFRGTADGVSTSEVRFSMLGPDLAVVDRDAAALANVGFDVVAQRRFVDGGDLSVVVHPPGAVAQAELLARYLTPIPALVEDSAATEITLVLGRTHQETAVFFPHGLEPTRAAIAELSDVPAPELGEATSTSSSTTTTSTSTSTTIAGTTTTFLATTTTAGITSTTTPASTAPRTRGRPPEGESCG